MLYLTLGIRQRSALCALSQWPGYRSASREAKQCFCSHTAGKSHRLASRLLGLLCAGIQIHLGGQSYQNIMRTLSFRTWTQVILTHKGWHLGECKKVQQHCNSQCDLWSLSWKTSQPGPRSWKTRRPEVRRLMSLPFWGFLSPRNVAMINEKYVWSVSPCWINARHYTIVYLGYPSAVSWTGVFLSLTTVVIVAKRFILWHMNDTSVYMCVFMCC